MKLLRHIIFFKLLVLLTIVSIPALAFSGYSFQQVTPKADTTRKTGLTKPVSGSLNTGAKTNPKDTAGGKVEYSAKDSTKVNKKEGIVYLYGKARVVNQGFELDADYIEYNTKTKQIFARGRKDAKGKYVGRPIFKMDGQGSSLADSLRYNTETAAGKIYGVFTEQEGGFFSGGLAKKQPDDEVHSKGQTYSTCNLPHPHYGIYITKGIVTEKQIITGPVYLKVEDIPLPLGLPFAFFPKPNKRSSGIIIPMPGEDFTRGFFLRDGGYYIGLSDYWDAKLLGTIYTRGSYEGSLNSNYTKRYKYNGSINLRYASNRYGLEGTPEYAPRKDFNIVWNHSQNANANPGTTFSASVDAGTGSYNTNTAGNGTYDPNRITNNTLRSSIAYGKQFGNGLFNLTAALSASQETQARTVSLTLPTVNLSMNTISPFDSKNSTGDKKWYQKITVGYTMQSSNSISTTESQLFKKGALNKFQNGFQHNIPISMAFNVLKYFNFNTGVNYTEKWHFQSFRRTYIRVINSNTPAYRIDTISGFNRYGTYNLNMGVSTKIYSTAQFTKFGNFKAIRHVMTPSINFSYAPDFSDPKLGNYKYQKYDDGTYVTDPITGKRLTYAIQEGLLYGAPGQGRTASISFSLDNTIEAKVLLPHDTTGKGEKKIPIIQGLNIGGSYNFLLPKYKLSNLSFSGRSPLTEKFAINYSGTLNPYLVGDSTALNGQRVQYVRDKYTWTAGKLPRLTSFNLSFDYSLNPEALKRKQVGEDTKKDALNKGMTPEQAEALAMVSRDPNAFVDFNIPWNFAFRYSFAYNTSDIGTNSNITNTLNFNGDANITPKWKVTFDSGWDFKANTFSFTRFSIYRDLHCWDMSFSWVPFGRYQSYSVDIKVKASILQDLKLSKRKNYYTQF